jgi:hypothetical protein
MNAKQKFLMSLVAIAAVSIVMYTTASADSTLETRPARVAVATMPTQVIVASHTAPAVASADSQETVPIEVAYLGYN